MRFGVYAINGSPITTPELIGELACAAEELEYDTVWVTDHVVMPAQLESEHPSTGTTQFTAESQETVYEPLATLAYLAGITKRVRLLSSVIVLPYRHPVVTAKMLATIDQLSRGRLIVGCGVGWLQSEFEALDANFAERGAVVDEMLRVFKALWTEKLPEFHGRFYDFGPVRFRPKPAQRPHPPLWIGGHSRPALRRAALLGDGWHATRQTPEVMRSGIAQLRESCRHIGRDPAELVVSLKCNLRLDQSPVLGADLCGDAAHIAEQIRTYAELGVELLILDVRPQTSLDQQLAVLRRFAREVRPLVERA